MKKILALLFLLPLSAVSMPLDSIGTKTENGVVYILHKIEKGQTLYGIARKYGADPNAVIKANPGSDKSIQADAVLLIPTKRTAASVNIQAAPPAMGEPKNTTKYHTVQSGETLFKIASLYGISVEDIKKWNGMTDDAISVGQKVAVSIPSAALAIPQTPAPKQPPVGTPIPDPVAVEPLQGSPAQQPVRIDAVSPPAGERITNAEIIKSDKMEGNPADEEPVPAVPSRQIRTIGDEVVENGTVEISSEGELAQERNFILHPTARIGTIVMITNPENGKSAFARVVGNYKAPSEQAAKINPTLAQKLSITDLTREVRVNYAR